MPIDPISILSTKHLQKGQIESDVDTCLGSHSLPGPTVVVYAPA